MSTLDQIATKIIKEQELIIGPVAWQEAGRVTGMQINRAAGSVSIQNGNPIVVDQLIERYEHLFGRASREASKEAVVSLVAELSPTEIPSSLK